MIRNTNTHFGAVSKLFHWAIVGLFCYLFYLAFLMSGMEFSPEKKLIIMEHKQYGVLLGILVLLRIVWKITNETPQQQAGTEKWKILLAKLTHFLLYVIMLGFPLTGIVMSMSGNHVVMFFGYELPNVIGENKELGDLAHSAHFALEYIAYSIISLHIIGALYHHFVVKDNVLKRMLPFGK